MKKFDFFIISGVLLGLIIGITIFTPVVVGAVGDIQLENPLGTTDISEMLGNIIKKLLTVLGSISLLVFVVGGFLWLTSAGNAEKVKLGTNTMLYAVIGLFIIFSSYAILNMVIGGVSRGGGAGSAGTNVAIIDTKNDLCKAHNPEWSCTPITNCQGVTLKPNADKKDWIAACENGKNCVNNKCLGTTDDTKCCLPKVSPVVGSGAVDERNVECKKANSAWSCMDIDECDLNLNGKTTVAAKRAVCTATKASCVTGKCNVGEDAQNNEIVCCQKAEIGSCIYKGEVCRAMDEYDCEALQGSFSFETCEQRAGAVSSCGCRAKELDKICIERSQQTCIFDSLCKLDSDNKCIQNSATNETIENHTNDYNFIISKCLNLNKGQCEVDTDCKCS